MYVHISKAMCSPAVFFFFNIVTEFKAFFNVESPSTSCSLQECKWSHWALWLSELFVELAPQTHQKWTQYKSGFVWVCFPLQGFRASPRHLRRRAAAAAAARLEEAKPVVEVHHQSEQEISVRKRRIKKNSRVQPEFYHSVQGASTRRPVSRELL